MTTSSKLPHVHLLVERDRFGNPHGSGQIRLLRPFSHPVLRERLRVTDEDAFPIKGADIVIVERGWRADATLETVADLVQSIRQSGARFIYTLDDNLLDLHLDEPWRKFSTALKRNIVRYLVRQADCVVVSTEPLKRRLEKLNRHIHVVPNALDERLFPQTVPLPSLRKRPTGKAVMGYMGTHSHHEDLMMIMEPLRAVLREYAGAVEFQLVGVSADARIVKCFEGLPFQVIETGGNHFYPDFVPWAKRHLDWDVALAPLADSVFTRSKSDIKYLDYAMLGLPGIYSDVDAYRQSVEHGKTGWLCRNSPSSWRDAIELTLTQPALRREVAKNAFCRVSETRLLKNSANMWLDVVFGIDKLERAL